AVRSRDPRRHVKAAARPRAAMTLPAVLLQDPGDTARHARRRRSGRVIVTSFAVWIGLRKRAAQHEALEGRFHGDGRITRLRRGQRPPDLGEPCAVDHLRGAEDVLRHAPDETLPYLWRRAEH